MGNTRAKVMGWVVTAVAALALLGPRPAWADQAQDIFDSLYGAEYKKAVASPDKKDDLALAVKLLAAAKEAKDQTELLAVLCQKAFDLTCTDSDGYPTAVEAMRLLSDTLPAEQAACRQKLLALYQHQYETGTGESRIAAGQTLCDELLGEADAQAKSRDYPAATKLLDRAAVIAVAVKSANLPDIQARKKAWTARMATAAQLGILKEKLKADPKDAATRNALVKALVTELDDPAGAAKYVDATCEASLQTFVPLAGGGLDAVGEDKCLDLADWYRKLAESTLGDAGKAVALRNAKSLYETFMEKHADNDLARKKAELTLGIVVKDLSKFPPAPGEEAVRVARAPEVQKAIDKAVKYFQAKQAATGIWPESSPEDTLYMTAVTVTALLEAGVSPRDANLLKALDYLAAENAAKTPGPQTQVVAWRAKALACAVRRGLTQYRPPLAKDAALLFTSIGADGSYVSWCMGNDRGRGMNHDTSVALMGVAAAADAKGAVAPAGYWAGAEKFWASTQNEDGGWPTNFASAVARAPVGPLTGRNSSTPAGTVDALAGLCLCLKQQAKPGFADSAPVKAALAYLAKNPLALGTAFDGPLIGQPPLPANVAPTGGRGPANVGPEVHPDTSQIAYNLGRLCQALGNYDIGGKESCKIYRAAFLNLQANDGSWSRGSWGPPSTAYALLFLAVSTSGQ